MATRSFTVMLNSGQIVEAIREYVRSMADPLMYDAAIDVSDEMQARVTLTRKRAPRKPRAKAAA